MTNIFHCNAAHYYQSSYFFHLIKYREYSSWHEILIFHNGSTRCKCKRLYILRKFYAVCHLVSIRQTIQICCWRQSLNQFTQFASDWNSWTSMLLASMNLYRNLVFTSSNTYCSMKRSDQDTSKVSPHSPISSYTLYEYQRH